VTTDLIERARPSTLSLSPRAPAALGDGLRRHWPWVGLVCVTLMGAAIRLQGLSSLGVWRDDAWAVMSSRVGLGTAWHMWATAPGFYFAERSVISLHPGVTWWAQLLPLIAGIAGIPAAFALARYFGFGPKLSLGVALLVSISPTCAIYSVRLKEYSTDFLLACLILALGEAARRRPDSRPLCVLTVVSVAGFAVSASTLPVIAGVWLALGVHVLRSREGFGRLAVSGAALAVGCLGVAAALYRHISPALHTFWRANYMSHRSPAAFVSSAHDVALSLYGAMLGLSVRFPLEGALVFVVVTGLLVLGARQLKAMASPALVLGGAVVACALGAIPLGTGRTDEVLYPAILLLLAAGLREARRTVTRLLSPSAARRVAAWTFGAATVGTFVVIGATVNVAYPGTDTRGLAQQLDHNRQSGDRIVVNELMRYPWALYEDTPLHLEFGPAWSAGFTVISTRPGVFIAPSEFYEGGSRPGAWVAALAGPNRVWFVESQPLSWSPFYAAMRADGWHAVRTLHAAGCAAILFERS